MVWLKKRWRCLEIPCARATFTEATTQVPTRARLTARLNEVITATVAGKVRAVDRVTSQFGVFWPTVQRQITAAALRSRSSAANDPGWSPSSASMSTGSDPCAGSSMTLAAGSA